MIGGKSGIRTQGTLSRSVAFEATAIVHSANSPNYESDAREGRRERLWRGVRDSNPGDALDAYTTSNRAHSSTLPTPRNGGGGGIRTLTDTIHMHLKHACLPFHHTPKIGARGGIRTHTTFVGGF